LNLANVFHEQRKIEDAIAGYERAPVLKSDADAHSNLGNALTKQGKIEEAIAACRRAIAIRPDFAEAHLNLSLALLLKAILLRVGRNTNGAGEAEPKNSYLANSDSRDGVARI
jgi:tetratricopeptide (TPR) repeat protein